MKNISIENFSLGISIPNVPKIPKIALRKLCDEACTLPGKELILLSKYHTFFVKIAIEPPYTGSTLETFCVCVRHHETHHQNYNGSGTFAHKCDYPHRFRAANSIVRIVCHEPKGRALKKYMYSQDGAKQFTARQ